MQKLKYIIGVCGHLCDLSLFFMRIQNLVKLTSLENLCITEKTFQKRQSQKLRHTCMETGVYRQHYSMNNPLIYLMRIFFSVYQLCRQYVRNRNVCRRNKQWDVQVWCRTSVKANVQVWTCQSIVSNYRQISLYSPFKDDVQVHSLLLKMIFRYQVSLQSLIKDDVQA